MHAIRAEVLSKRQRSASGTVPFSYDSKGIKVATTLLSNAINEDFGTTAGMAFSKEGAGARWSGHSLRVWTKLRLHP